MVNRSASICRSAIKITNVTIVGRHICNRSSLAFTASGDLARSTVVFENKVLFVGVDFSADRGLWIGGTLSLDHVSVAIQDTVDAAVVRILPASLSTCTCFDLSLYICAS